MSLALPGAYALVPVTTSPVHSRSAWGHAVPSGGRIVLIRGGDLDRMVCGGL
jgi:hypothetical protein